jgi:hypothetical protein
MNKYRLFSYGVLALTVAVILFFLLGSLGFPDGHLTEADRALKVLYKAGILLNSFFALCFLYAGITKKIPDNYMVVLKYGFLFSGTVIFILYFCMRHFLEDGQGG